MHASPAKLPDDTWGIRIYDPEGDAADWSGQGVTVETKAGKSWNAQLGDLVQSDAAKHTALYRKADKKAAKQPVWPQQPLPPIAGAQDAEPDTGWIVDVIYHGETASPATDATGEYGPFATRQAAEQALIALAGRSDVKEAKILTD